MEDPFTRPAFFLEVLLGNNYFVSEGGLVDSVFTRTGDVVAAPDDYTWAQVDKATSDIADITTKNHTDLVAGDGTDHSRVLNGLGTGILTGGELTINADDSKFDIAAGSGLIINNHTDPTNPVVTDVSWSAKTAVVTTYLATNPWSFIGIDSGGNVVQQTSMFTPDQLRDIIVIGKAVHTNNTNIVVAISYKRQTYNVDLDLRDFIDAFDTFNIEGNIISANGANLKVDKSAGKMYRLGANYPTSKKVPSITDESSASQATLGYEYRDGGTGWNASWGATQIDPTKWDNDSGVLQTVTSGKWTIQPLFIFGKSGRIWIQYGQVEYDTKEDALANRLTAFSISPHFDDAVLRGWLIVKEDATALNDTAQAEFITAGKFGLVDVVCGNVGGEANTATNIGIGGTGLFKTKAGVNLQFKNINAGSNKITITDDTGNDEIDIDISEANLAHVGQELIDAHKQSALYDNGDSGAAKTIDWNNGIHQKIRMTDDCTFTFTAPTSWIGDLTLRCLEDGTGSRVATWPATVHGEGDSDPVLSTPADAIDIIRFFWDGTYYVPITIHNILGA